MPSSRSRRIARKVGLRTASAEDVSGLSPSPLCDPGQEPLVADLPSGPPPAGDDQHVERGESSIV